MFAPFGRYALSAGLAAVFATCPAAMPLRADPLTARQAGIVGCWENESRVSFYGQAEPYASSLSLCVTETGRAHFVVIGGRRGGGLDGRSMEWSLDIAPGRFDTDAETCAFLALPTRLIIQNCPTLKGDWTRRCAMPNAAGDACASEP